MNEVRLIKLFRGALRIAEWHVDAGAQTACGINFSPRNVSRDGSGRCETRWVPIGGFEYETCCAPCRQADAGRRAN